MIRAENRLAASGGSAAVRISYRLPCEALRHHVRLYYLFEADRPHAQFAAAELGNLRFDLGARSSIAFGEEALRPAHVANLIGVTNAAYRVVLPAGARVFGATLLPLGWATLIGASADQMSDALVDFGAVAGPAAERMSAELGEAQTFDALCAATDRCLIEALERGAPRRAEIFPSALQNWLLEPAASLDALVAVVGVSRRQVDRLAHSYFGGAPRLLQRKQKAVRAALGG
ncbi:MAG: hypothetical protein K2Q06_09720 [Parvularculaceae bacterium]|nr:hypothetical protein [Parvularculaceae bacterium]